jgi:hypothetical protein
VIGYAVAPSVNSVVVGLLVVVLALRGGRDAAQFGGGWSSRWSWRSSAVEHPTYGSAR